MRHFITTMTPKAVIALSFWSLFPSFAYANSSRDGHQQGLPPVALANDYRQSIVVKRYWFSEKYDGIRAIWNGQQLITRTGNPIYAPSWFTAGLPNDWIEGELWAGRGNFHTVQKTVLDHQPDSRAWRHIQWMVFDMPKAAGVYPQRYALLSHWVTVFQRSHVRLVDYQPVVSHQQLLTTLAKVDDQQGEGIMLQSVTDDYRAGRSDALLKLKSVADAEATVIGYKPGQGRWKGMVGSLKVRDNKGQVFFLGSGLSEQQRRHPPAIGSSVTFRHNGFTYKGTPRFARFLRERMPE